MLLGKLSLCDHFLICKNAHNNVLPYSIKTHYTDQIRHIQEIFCIVPTMHNIDINNFMRLPQPDFIYSFFSLRKLDIFTRIILVYKERETIQWNFKISYVTCTWSFPFFIYSPYINFNLFSFTILYPHLKRGKAGRGKRKQKKLEQ